MLRPLLLLLGAVWSGHGLSASITVRVTDANGLPLPHAVVTLSGAGLLPQPPPARAEVNQLNTQFQPHVLIIPRHTSVAFPNLDNTRHQVYSFSAVKRFTTNLFAGHEADPVEFDQPGLVAIGCNIHDRMHAYIYVTEAPRFTVTGADGLARFDGLDTGDYRIEALHPWQARANSFIREVRVRRAGQSLEQSVNVGATGPDPRTPRRQSTNPLIRSNPLAR
jgi:plastocyanin